MHVISTAVNFHGKNRCAYWLSKRRWCIFDYNKRAHLSKGHWTIKWVDIANRVQYLAAGILRIYNLLQIERTVVKTVLVSARPCWIELVSSKIKQTNGLILLSLWCEATHRSGVAFQTAAANVMQELVILRSDQEVSTSVSVLTFHSDSTTAICFWKPRS